MTAPIRAMLRAAAGAARKVGARAALDFVTAAPLAAAEAEGRKLRAVLAVIAWAAIAADVLLAIIAAGVWKH